MRNIPAGLAALLMAVAALAARAQPAEDFDPSTVPLVEVIGAQEAAIQGVAIAANQVLLAPGDKWAPGARVRRVDTGDEARITRVLNWGGRSNVEWAILEVEWPDGAAPAPLTVATADAETGTHLRVVAWRDSAYVVFARATDEAHCPNCAHHIPYTGDDEEVRRLRRGSPVLNERGELAGILHERGFRASLRQFRGGLYMGYIPRSRWQVESVEAVSAERFGEILRDQKSSRAAVAAARAAVREAELTEAVYAAREAIRLDPNQAEAWKTLGYTAYKSGRYGIAVTALGNALRREHDVPSTTALLAMSRAAREEDEEAAQLALSVEKNWPDETVAVGNAAQALLMVGRRDDARRLLRGVLEREPENSWASEMLSRIDGREQGERR